MAMLIRCECGFIARGQTEEEVIGNIRQHLLEVHPPMAASVTEEDLLGWIEFD
jgi:predicted small metal-binding protein